MNQTQLRRLVYTTGAIALLGVLLSVSALDVVNRSTGQADTALERGAMSGPSTPAVSGLAMVVYERANDQASRATLLLALLATLTPVCIFLNLLRLTGRSDGRYRDPLFPSDPSSTGSSGASQKPSLSGA